MDDPVFAHEIAHVKLISFHIPVKTSGETVWIPESVPLATVHWISRGRYALETELAADQGYPLLLLFTRSAYGVLCEWAHGWAKSAVFIFFVPEQQAATSIYGKSNIIFVYVLPSSSWSSEQIKKYGKTDWMAGYSWMLSPCAHSARNTGDITLYGALLYVYILGWLGGSDLYDNWASLERKVTTKESSARAHERGSSTITPSRIVRDQFGIARYVKTGGCWMVIFLMCLFENWDILESEMSKCFC